MARAELTLPGQNDLCRSVQAQTPARLLVGRAGTAYRTATQLELRRDHAAALDAVHAELDLEIDYEPGWVVRHRLFMVQTQAGSKAEHLARPDLGRRLNDMGIQLIQQRCVKAPDLQIVLGDGLSALAVKKQAPALLDLLIEWAGKKGWRIGQPFVIRHCRVGVLNDIGALLEPAVVVLFIGERPGLATAESLSAYLAYRPRPGHTDAQRNLISNIHERGVGIEEAARRILALAEKMRHMQASGIAVKEDAVSKPITGP